MMEQPEPKQQEPERFSSTEPPLPRGIQLGLVAVIVLAFLGFFVGIQQDAWLADRFPPTVLPPSPAAGDFAERMDRDVVPAISYAELDRRQFGPNRDWRSTLETQPTLSAFLEVAPSDDVREIEPGETDAQAVPAIPPDKPVEQWLAGEPESADSARQRALALSKRAQRRAFEGAPPVVPHPIDFQGTSSCLACHAEGRLLGRGIVAPAMSHGPLANCTQCHVEEESFAWRRSRTSDDAEIPENTFAGYQSLGTGNRAWPGAPPTVPHPIVMREHCLSCHGPHGSEPLRTSHPFRASCLQCHAPSADWHPVFRDQSPVRISTSDSENK